MIGSLDEARILLVGAGPAGISAALWCHSLELPFAWMAPEGALGGTLLRVGNPIHNYPGARAPSGAALAERFVDELEQEGLSPCRGHLLGVGIAEDGQLIAQTSAGALRPDQMVLCTGTRPRLLGLPGEAELVGRGVEISVTRTRARYAGREVAIVGGGDAALEGALLLAERCPRVHLIHRRTAFRGQERFVDAVSRHASIVLHLEDSVSGIAEQEGGLALSLSGGDCLRVGGLFVRIGVAPCIPEGFPGDLLDDSGYILTDREGRTGLPGVYAAGDVTGRLHQSVAWAVGSAARTIEAVQRDGGWKGERMGSS